MRLVNKVALGILGLATFIATPSLAADLAVKAPAYKAPVLAPAPVQSWTGFYIGGNIGGVTNTNSGTTNFTDSIIGGAGFPAPNRQNASGFLGGGQVGYNWQFDPHWLIGVEADGDFTNAKYGFCRGTIVAGICGDTGFGTETLNSKTDWITTVRGRFGTVVMDKFLLYVTGGAAWGRVETTATQSCLVGGCGASPLATVGTSNSSVTRQGWVAGLGAEWNVERNWFVRAEWLHTDLGNITSSVTTAGFAGSFQTFTWSRSDRLDQFRVGLDYRFWPG